MKTRNKAPLLALCAVLLVAVSVLGTMAYLTDTETVTNTFSVGHVAITLDEQDVDEDSDKTDNVNGRDKANYYRLIPGHKYIKDPIIHIGADSEDCWVFVKVENGIAAFEAATSAEKGYNNIADQIAANGWTPLQDVSNVYYKSYTKGQTDKDYKVFQEFKLADDAESKTGWSAITPENTTIRVTGYAVQKDGFEADVKAAWNAVSAS